MNNVSKPEAMGVCSDMMYRGEYIDASRAIEILQDLGMDITEEEVKDLYELKVKVNYELV